MKKARNKPLLDLREIQQLDLNSVEFECNNDSPKNKNS